MHAWLQVCIDTRPHCEALNDLITLNKETGERGNPVWSNLPRKFNIAVARRVETVPREWGDSGERSGF